jgi:hypothetical protein
LGPDTATDTGTDAAAATDAGTLARADGGTTASADGGAAAFTIPPENREGSRRPSPAAAEAWAPRLFAAIQADDPEPVIDLYFPADIFDRVKGIADPATYHRRLLRWYREDLHTEHARFSGVASMTYERFQIGRCTWQEAWSEGNRIPYWSCRHNFIHVRDGSRRKSFELRVMINWGTEWYITHLGPIRRF